MGNSVVDLGAAAVDYVKDVASDIGEGIESFYDYLTESPKASAGGYYRKLGPGARQYFSGPGEEKGESFFEYLGFEEGGDVPEGIMSVDLSMGADTTGPDTMKPIPQYPGIEGFDIYKDLAPEQFDRRKIQDQRFNESRQFQKGQMVQRDEAVSGKLLKQAGIMTPVEVVKQNADPKVMEQVSRIMGRQDIV